MSNFTCANCGPTEAITIVTTYGGAASVFFGDVDVNKDSHDYLIDTFRCNPMPWDYDDAIISGLDDEVEIDICTGCGNMCYSNPITIIGFEHNTFSDALFVSEDPPSSPSMNPGQVAFYKFLASTVDAEENIKVKDMLEKALREKNQRERGSKYVPKDPVTILKRPIANVLPKPSSDAFVPKGVWCRPPTSIYNE